MPESNPILISALRETAARLSRGVKYEWGHMGRCNCGHLVQTITNLTDLEIVEAVENEMNEWTEHARDYCTVTNSRASMIFEKLKSYGFSYEDVMKLEYLSDRSVLKHIPGDQPLYLRNNKVEDVILYMDTMADMLEHV